MVIASELCPRIFCGARMLPPLIMKWLANVCRITWADDLCRVYFVVRGEGFFELCINGNGP